MLTGQVSSHPFLFDWPSDPQTGELIINDNLVNASGKMLLLNRLLDVLFERKHKVLIFSQFTTMLDVIVRFSARSVRSCADSNAGGLGDRLQGA